ncbi:MAG: 30S ribosomal protein S17 [Candidatus Woesearchaeota archaeon]
MTPTKKNIIPRGKTLVGTVIADRMARTVTVEWERRKYISKFERFEKRRSRIKAHNPESINAKVGDKVIVCETRPISKTKHFIVTEIVNKVEKV